MLYRLIPSSGFVRNAGMDDNVPHEYKLIERQ